MDPEDDIYTVPGRIPVNLKIHLEESEQNHVLELFRNSRIFSSKTLCKTYFSFLTTSILENKDPVKFINDNIPEIEGLLFIDLAVIRPGETSPASEIPFIYIKNMNDEQFNIECVKARSLIVQQLEKEIQDQKASFFTMSGMLPMLRCRKETAHLYFIRKDYKNALQSYESISSQYPELSGRMCELCRVILNYKPCLDPLAFDILIANDMYESLYKISDILPFDAQLALQYYLTTKNIDFRLKMIVLYQCNRNLRQAREFQKAESCYLQLTEMVEKRMVEDQCNRDFWREFFLIMCRNDHNDDI